MEDSYSVKLYVYDLSGGMAKQFSQAFMGKQFEGIWHTGIVVYNEEYFFGGGIQTCSPGHSPYGTPLKTVDLGETQIPKEVFTEFLNSIRFERFAPDKYDLFENNCNHFTNEAAIFLTGNSIPEWILHLPREALATPMGQMIRPFIDSMMGKQPVPVNNPATTALAQQYPQQPHSYASTTTAATTGSVSRYLNDAREPRGFVSPINSQQLMSKLKSLMEESGIQLTDIQHDALVKVAEFLSLDSKTMSSASDSYITSAVLDTLDFLVERLPEKSVFPVIDIMRVLVLYSPTSVRRFIPETAANDGILEIQLRNIVANWTNTSVPTRLMTLRLICNLFVPQYYTTNAPGIAYLMNNEARLSTVVDMLAHAFVATADSVRSIAGLLASNIALFADKNCRDSEIQLLSTLAHVAPDELVPDICFNMLLAMFRMLQGNPLAVELINTLEPNFEKIITNAGSEEKNQRRAEDTVTAIRILLRSK